MRNILDVSPSTLAQWLASRNLAGYRCNQIMRWLYQRQADSFSQMSDLSKADRQLLHDHFSIARLKPMACEKAADGTRKYLFGLQDGQCMESVLIAEKDHFTLCISSQVGCAQKCRFCMTGAMGFKRNLSTGEIVSQVRDIQKDLGPERPLRNIVFMGMGEPLANHANVIQAIAILTDKSTGMGFSNRRVTLSTVGLVPAMQKVPIQTGINLAVSLNATENATRDALMPINKAFPIERLLATCRKLPLPKGRRITFEYVLLKGINDTADDARRLTRLLRPRWAKINLIPFNEHAACRFQRPDAASVDLFREILTRQDFAVMVRLSKGQEISAACGQLGTTFNPRLS